ncbi:MAG TPA: 50S ribosomal protein L18 [Candidatus Omnitrophota bacterium]|nr:50S ribosomal protein L18 [Candidatus Omnitrophota bacterium]HPN89039.1 50S ribosomal protein L18 [Candidatus Omnitrophota bacterium]
MSPLNKKEEKRVFRHERLRKKISGTTERPRLCVHRSHKNLTAQVIDDMTGKVLLGMSTVGKKISATIKNGGNIDGASQFGEVFAAEAKKKGIFKVSFDRCGNLFHGRIKAFADGVRKGGLQF